MNKCFFILSVFVLFYFNPICANALKNEDISAKSAIVISADTNEVIFEKNAYEKLPMASTTKIMTSILALEYGANEFMYQVTEEMVNVEGSSIGLLADDKISLKTLVKGMLLESGNDAANTVAHVVGGSVEDFVSLMNYKAKEIGMNSTSFETPSGLDGESHYSTAFDMAVLGSYAIKNPEFRKICSSQTQVVYYGNEPYRRVFSNNNKLLKVYDGAFGIKTGFTKKSGRCLVSAVQKDGKTLVAVTLNAPDDWNDHIKMYDYSFDLAQTYNLTCDMENIEIAVVGGEKSSVSVKFNDIIPFTTIDNSFSYNSKIFIEKFLYAPVNSGDIVGFVEFYDKNNNLLQKTYLVADEGVALINMEENVEKTFLDKIIDLFR